MSFEEVCAECIGTPELVKEWNRLTGNHLGEHRNGIEKMIDDSCGYDPDAEAMPAFAQFVFEYLWLPLMQSSMEETI